MTLELKRIKNNTYSLRIGYSDIGLYLEDRSRAVLIDSGSREEPELLAFLMAEGITPRAIVNTHLHIDHIGNNELLCAAYGCDAFASEAEIAHENDAGYEVGGRVYANPDNGYMGVCGFRFEVIASRGHSCGHQFVITPDGVCFAGDAIMSEEVLAHTRMPYFYDIHDSIESIRKLSGLDYPVFALSHNGAVTRKELYSVCEANLRKERQMQAALRSVINDRIPVETLIELFLRKLEVAEGKRDISWVRKTVFARIRELERLGQISIENTKVFE